MERISLDLNRRQWRAVVTTVMKLRLIKRKGIYWLSERLLSSQESLCSRNQQQACCLLHAGFLPGLLYNPEDEEDMFLRNVD
jgi:hypothetical protein